MRRPRSDRNHVIYLVQCIATGQRYIGLTVARGRAFQESVRTRWRGHVHHALVENRAYTLPRAIREHGPTAFKLFLVEVVRGKPAAHRREGELIQAMKPELNELCT